MLELENELSDQDAITLLADLAKREDEAFTLLINLQNCSEFGEKDMIVNRIHRYLKDYK